MQRTARVAERARRRTRRPSHSRRTHETTGFARLGSESQRPRAASHRGAADARIADITARSLAVSATGVNKAYDGTTSATVSLSDNRLVGDILTTSYTSASFADKNVGTAKSVSVSAISISGTDAANYIANTPATGMPATISASPTSSA